VARVQLVQGTAGILLIKSENNKLANIH